jgi:uncharacterized protein (DUF362 family)
MKIAIAKAASYDESCIRDALLSMFEQMGLPNTNPLSSIINPGNRVFIKPNWLTHEYRQSCNHNDSGKIFSVITHPTIIRVVADLVATALQGKGEIIIGDNPSIDANFSKLMDLIDIRDLEKRYDVPCRILDLRHLVCTDLRYYGNRKKMVEQEGDPEGYSIVNLGKKSLFYGINPILFRGIFDSRWETIFHHLGQRHEYGFSNTILNTDVYISLPKLKTHHKVGVTLNLKGLVGTNCVKNYLVHWRVGFPLFGGDAYPDFFSWVKDFFAPIKKRGAWSGNDTIWRMVVDLYSIIHKRVPRTFSVVDGILGGELNGPFCPKAKESGVLIAGEDLLAVDCVTTRLMDFNVHSIPYLDFLIKQEKLDLAAIKVVSEDFPVKDFFSQDRRYLGFVPPDYWRHLAIGTPTENDGGLC